MANPLSLLREYNIKKKPITEKNKQIIFGECSYLKTIKTNYVVFGSGKGGTSKEYYTLECLLYFLKNLLLSHPVYCEQAREDNVSFVRRSDRKALLAYLNGEKDTSASIDESASVKIPNTAMLPDGQETPQDVKETQQDVQENRTVCIDLTHDVSKMADPLSLLREYNINKRPVIERNNLIIFGECSWPKTVKTNYVISGKKGTPKEYYTLECLLYFLKNLHLLHPVYCQQARDDNVPAVRRPDRKALSAYLNGETNTSANIDESFPIEIPETEHRYIELFLQSDPDDFRPEPLGYPGAAPQFGRGRPFMGDADGFSPGMGSERGGYNMGPERGGFGRGYGSGPDRGFSGGGGGYDAGSPGGPSRGGGYMGSGDREYGFGGPGPDKSFSQGADRSFGGGAGRGFGGDRGFSGSGAERGYGGASSDRGFGNSGDRGYGSSPSDRGYGGAAGERSYGASTPERGFGTGATGRSFGNTPSERYGADDRGYGMGGDSYRNGMSGGSRIW